MAPAKRGSAFIVITEDPQQDRGKRLSEVRSHLAKERHRSRRGKDHLVVHGKGGQAFMVQEDTLSLMPKEIVVRHKSPPLASSAIGYRRMQKFMHEYVLYGHQVHPFFSHVINAAVSHTALMSTKILNASAWDDLNTEGQVSDLTLQQHVITRKLLGQVLEDVELACSEPTLAALVATLLFDMVNDLRDIFVYDLKVMHQLMTMRGGLNNMGFEGHVKSSLLVIEQLQRVVEIPPYASFSAQFSPGTDLDIPPSASIDVALLTLGMEPASPSEWNGINRLIPVLSSFYEDVLLSTREAHCRTGLGLDCRLAVQKTTPLFDTPRLYDQIQHDDNRIPALLQAIMIMERTHHATSDTEIAGLADAIAYLKDLLQATDLDNCWTPLSGALIWCLSIGARRSFPGAVRKWFVMQTARVSCAIAMNRPDAVVRCLRVVVEGLDGADFCRRNRYPPHFSET